jgi:hypothetical protein
MSASSGRTTKSGVWLLGLLIALVAASLAIHGYHYGIEDESIYLPAIKLHLNPSLYPHDAEFFQPQARATRFVELVATTARLLHAPVDWTVFGYYLGTLLAFYAALWALASRLFAGMRGRLGGLLLVGALLTLPVAGTCVFLVDQHLHPRTLATALILWAAARLAPRAWGEPVALREYGWAAMLMAGATLIHVQMAFYGVLFLGVLILPPRVLQDKFVFMAGLAPMFLTSLTLKGGPEWQEASRTRTQHYLMQWEWYEWLGAIAPFFVLWAMARLARRRGFTAASAVAVRTALFAAIGFAAGCVITIPPQLERLTAYQPLRTLHLTYLMMVLLAGGLLAELVLKQKAWRWAVLLLPIAAGMCYAQFESLPDSHHVEWPGQPTGNDWVEAFDWVKANTPVDAYFVLDPRYMSSPGEDYHGFRGLAERGQMADWDKDPGVALLFPELAVRWSHEVHALDKWKSFKAEDFHRLHEQFGVGWTVLPYGSRYGNWGKYAGEYAAPIPASDCVWHNRSVVVCRIK